MNRPASPPLELHLVPGLFSAGAAPLLERLIEGRTRLCVRSLLIGGQSEDDPAVIEERLLWLGAPDLGELRALEAVVGTDMGGKTKAHFATLGVGPEDRALFGLAVAQQPVPTQGGAAGGLTRVDWEIVLLGLACAALAGEDQGVAMIGEDLAPLGVGLARGTVSEQVAGILEIQGEALRVLVLAKSTALKLKAEPGWQITRLGDLESRRRTEVL